MGVAHTLVTSALVGAVSSARAGVAVTELALRRTAPLVALGARATIARDADAAWAQAVFRDELLALFDDAAEIAWREARRARMQLGERTAPPDERAASAPRHATGTALAGGAPRRRHRVKA